jgi:SNF2 family DNA or RNA helicase
MSLHWMQKLAESTPSGPEGHWRKLPPDYEGTGPQGQPQKGRTWVRRGRMKEGMKPMPHQADFTKAVKQRLGGKGGGGIIAAHGTGTGKTFSAINAFEELKDEGKARRALVLVPAGLRDNFLKKGIEKFTNSKGVILKQPEEVGKRTEYVVVSYAAFRQNPDAWLEKVKPDTIIADEVHRAANPAGKTYQSLRYARDRVPRFMGLTASVVQNKPSEIVPLVDLATGGEHKLKGRKDFRREHIKRERTKRKGIFGGRQYEERLVKRALLNAKVGGTVHYIEDLDASKKPAKDVETVEVKMNSDQLKLYRLSMRGVDPVVAKKIQEGKPVSQREAMNVFMKLMRARQVSNSLHLATPNMSLKEAARQTPKIKRILDDAVDHIKKTPDAQVIMYTNMVHGGVDVLEAGLKERGISYGIFAGKGVEGVTEETRQQAVNDYLEGKNKVIVITGAGAEGLSLGNTTMVQMVDGHYNPERISQAEARGVRAGGLSHRPAEERKVKVKRYVTTLPKTFWQTITFQQPKKSVGQWVYLTADRKRQLNRELRDVLKQRSEHERKKRESTLYRWFGGGP